MDMVVRDHVNVFMVFVIEMHQMKMEVVVVILDISHHSALN